LVQIEGVELLELELNLLVCNLSGTAKTVSHQLKNGNRKQTLGSVTSSSSALGRQAVSSCMSGMGNGGARGSMGLDMAGQSGNLIPASCRSPRASQNHYVIKRSRARCTYTDREPGCVHGGRQWLWQPRFCLLAASEYTGR
jgi:hypothetical protein